MLTPFYEKLHITDTVSVIIVSIALMLICGFAATRVTKRLRLPNVTAYIVAGILIGPYCLNLVPGNVIDGMDFIADIALAFIAFSTGEFFKFDTLKKSGGKVMVITVFEAILASVLVFIITFFVLGLELNFSIVLAALASATAPASTVMTIRQTHAKGDFVDTLLQVVALDDVVGLVAYSIAISVALASATGAFHAGAIFKPLAINALVLLLGGGFGFFLKLLLHKRSTDNRLIVSIALLFAFCGICAMLDVSPLLGCMSMGMVYINLTDDKRLFQQLNYFSPPILLLFFVRSGLNFDLDALVDNSESIGTTPLVVVGILYFLVRIVGKYAGAFLGCLVTKKDKKVRNFLGLALIPQAGVAIGLAATGARTLGGEVGNALETIILASSVLYELIGPACAKLSLYLSGSYSNKLEDLAPIPATEPGQPPKSEVELLIERIQAIQQELPKHNNPYYEDEQAFTEAAAEHSAQMEAFFGTPGKANTAMPGEETEMKELLSIEDPIAGLLGAWSAELNLGSALLRIALIVALAASIGCERSSKRHSAGLRTFVLAAFSATVSMLLDQYVYVLLGCKLPLLSAATLLAVTSVSANSILYSSRGQIKGLTTSAGLVSCCILGFATGAGLYTLTLIVYIFLLCILAGFPAIEAYLKNRSNHFEVHMELKSSSYLRDFVTVSRRLGLRIDDIEANQAYAGSGLSVYSVSLTICSQELKKYKTHVEIIEALSSLDYIYHIEEMH